MAFIGAIIGATIGGSVLSGLFGKKAADTSANAANNANASLDARYRQMRADELPFITAGTDATTRLSDLLGTSGNTGASGYGSLTKPFTAQDYLNNVDPGYQFQLQQGSQALQNRQAAGSGALSGPALKDLMAYNQEYAKTGFNEAFNRQLTQQNNIFTRLSGLATLGQNAASQTGAQGVAVGQQQSANTTAAGNAGAAAQANIGNNLTQAGTDLSLLLRYPPPAVKP